MVKTREEQLGPITVLDEDQDGYVNASGANIHNVNGIRHVQRGVSPGNNSVWIDDSNPSFPKFTDADGNDYPLIEGTGGGTYYVDADAGSDSNPGTQASPFATLDKALQTVGSIIKTNTFIYINNTATVTGYDSDEFWKPRLYRADLNIIGNEVSEVYSATAITSYSSRVYNFSGATPGWTTDQFVGDFLEFVSGPTAIPVGQKRTIIHNTADTIIAANRHVSPAFAQPQAGDTFRIVSPSVAIDATEPEVGSNLGSSRKLYGGEVFGTNTLFQQPRNILKLQNLELRVQDSQSHQSIQMSGIIEANGCVFSKNSTNELVLDIRGTLFSGSYYDADVNVVSMGYISVSKDRGGNTVLPHIEGNFMEMYGGFVGGTLECHRGCVIDFRGSGSRFDGRGRTAFPHATIFAAHGSHITINNAFPYFYIHNIDGGEWDFECENGIIEINAPITHLGTGRYARARHQGLIKIYKTPTVGPGASGLEIDALYGGQIRIISNNGSTLGDARAGQTFGVTRAAGAWELKEVISGSESSSIYRTA